VRFDKGNQLFFDSPDPTARTAQCHLIEVHTHFSRRADEGPGANYRGVVMNFGEAIKSGFSNYVNFSDRAIRSEYWFWTFFWIIGIAIAIGLDLAIFNTPGLLYFVFTLATFLPGLAVTIRRLHDLDRSGWWIFLNFVPLIGVIVLIVWFCTRGTSGPNRFGPDSLPQPGHGHGLWIAGEIFAVLLALFALLYAVFPRFLGPIKMLYGSVSGNPSLPNCRTTVAHEATVGPLWYRVLDVDCSADTIHFVYAKRGTGPGFFVFPAFISAGSPVPVSVRPAAPGGFEVLLSEPLADGRTAVPLELGSTNAKLFDHGRETRSLTLHY
jgi:uncharacterized membrane protein YhaH (DUF805 family)